MQRLFLTVAINRLRKIEEEKLNQVTKKNKSIDGSLKDKFLKRKNYDR
jgi:hypothetical protein